MVPMGLMVVVAFACFVGGLVAAWLGVSKSRVEGAIAYVDHEAVVLSDDVLADVEKVYAAHEKKAASPATIATTQAAHTAALKEHTAALKAHTAVLAPVVATKVA